jgi:1,4-dihydroxy-2-naphthoyl-CoA hydrolase
MIASLDELNARGVGKLPEYVGIVFTQSERNVLCAELELKQFHMAPNGFLHAGSIITLADTTCGYGCYANLPEGATGFTTIELKSNHLGTAREGTIVSRATPVHLGRTTQVWDAVVTHKESGRTLALFRCTQLVLYPK